MEYALRCNRFREHLENPHRPHQNYKQIRNNMKITNFEHASFHTKTIIISPERPKHIERIKLHETPVQLLKNRIMDHESDKTTHRTEITYSTELHNHRPSRIANVPNERLNYSLPDALHTPKKRKTHFLTVVSRLPGMSKSKKKVNCS